MLWHAVGGDEGERGRFRAYSFRMAHGLIAFVTALGAKAWFGVSS